MVKQILLQTSLVEYLIKILEFTIIKTKHCTVSYISSELRFQNISGESYKPHALTSDTSRPVALEDHMADQC